MPATQRFRDKIWHHTFQLEGSFNGAVGHAADSMFNLLVGFFLPEVSDPLGMLGLVFQALSPRKFLRKTDVP
jgi:hypothetical protein